MRISHISYFGGIFLFVLYATSFAIQTNVHPLCANFSRGNEILNEFFSPGWPNNYPKNINCTRRLTAPVGHIIHVDFRDIFHLEPSLNCSNDYLLIRDGPEAYSREIHRFCGHNFPPMIASTGRYLWFMFRSDDTIQHRGFRIVYSFQKDLTSVNPPLCMFELSGSEMIVSTDNISDDVKLYAYEKGTALDCNWRISVRPLMEIQISFKVFQLDKPNECEVNFIEILYGSRLSLTRQQLYCSSKADVVKLGVGNDATLRYYAVSYLAPSTKARVVAVITEMRQRDNDETCLSDEFDCDDLYCINRSLHCNGNFNCIKQLDEKRGCPREGMPPGALEALTTDTNIVVLTFGCALLLGMCVSMCVNCVRKLRADNVLKPMGQCTSTAVDTTHTAQCARRASSISALESAAKCYVPIVDTHNGCSLSLISTATDTGCARNTWGACTHDTTQMGRVPCRSGHDTQPPLPSREHAGHHCRDLSCGATACRQLPECQRRHSAYMTLPACVTHHTQHQPAQGVYEVAGAGGTERPRRYVTEAVIELAQCAPSLKPAKSAPDVIIKL